jgi:fucokinase
VLQAIAALGGEKLTDPVLSDQVMRLEQLLTTGGGWQDQAGGIFPGAKLLTTGPGLWQRLRVQPLAWDDSRRAEFAGRFVLYYTGIRRVAKGLLGQVVGSYLAREVATLQVLHSIKTLAMEMAYAVNDGEWEYLGRLMDRHWRLNQVLDPHTTNAPIDALLGDVRPHLAGAKLAGAGGGGFLMLLAKDPEHAADLRSELATPSANMPGELFNYEVADKGLVIRFQ